MDKRVEELIERGVSALEKLAQDEIEFQVETKPPVCPHCERINPSVRIDEAHGSGPLVEHFTQAQCLHCNRVFYVIPLHVECLKNEAEARMLIEEKVSLGGYERNGTNN